jgi:uncharacterized membrane protein YeaQ/YmgE (transglycosylase-associated protein family)
MNISQLFVQLVIALICAVIGSLLIPRKIPGKLLGLIVIGLAGVWLGNWSVDLLSRQYGLNYEFLKLQIEGVRLIPSIIGSAIVLYVVTLLLKIGRYE